MRKIIPLLVLAVACFAFAGLSVIEGQDAKEKEAKEAKEGCKGCKGCEEEAKPKEDKEKKVLSEEEYDDLMEDKIKKAWNKLKINARKKMGPQAAKYAAELDELAPEILKYDGLVLTGENKGKKARDQKDFKEFVKNMQKYAKDYAKYAKKGKWDKADKAKDGISDTCSGCHDLYEPEEEE